MNFHVLTLFPEMISTASRIGLVGQAIANGKIGLNVVNPRSFTENTHQTVDDRPFGGGDGMIMLADVMEKALESVRAKISPAVRSRVIHLSPRGRPLTDRLVRELSEFHDLVIISSRYGGIDQRFLNSSVDEEISIGDFVLSGGEIAALALMDSVGRLIPGVLGNEKSPQDESFSGPYGLLEYPQFTRPREWKNEAPPAMLLSGDHKKIDAYKISLSILVTADRRPELLNDHDLPFVQALKDLEAMTDAEFQACGLGNRVELRDQLAALADRQKRRGKT